MTEQDRRQQILEGALHVFSEQGYHKASIKEIAKAAGIKSSALIYHYFADKKAVLSAIIEEMTPLADIPIFRNDVPSHIWDTMPEVLLPTIANRILGMADNPFFMAAIRLFISEAARMNEIGDAVADIQKKGIGFFRRYLEHHISTGYLRPHDTAASSRAFIGMMLAYVLGQAIFSGVRDGMPEREVYVEEAVRLYVEGLRKRE